MVRANNIIAMPEITIQQAFELAIQHQQAGRLQEAETLYRQILAVEPRHADSLHLLGLIAHQVGRNDVAADLITQAISAAGNAIPTTYLGNLAWVRVQLGEAFEAERLAREALRFQPGFANFHNTLGNALYLQGRITEAAQSWKQAFDIDGTNASALGNWANVLQETGRIREAMAAHKRATEIDPQPAAAWDNYLRDLGFLPDPDPVFVKEEHEKWAETFLRSVNAGLIHKNHTNPRDPERKLNIGLVSPDFRQHSVTYFIEPLFRHLDREKFSIFCYANVHAPDETTARLQGYPAVWRNIVGLDDAQAAGQIVRDGIDILIDLGGHTSKNRCRILAYKPAPLQITYLGYPYTTGLQSCDYRLTDEVSDPPGLTEDHYTEKLLRLPVCSWCFQPPAFDVPVAAAPLEKNGRITFGSFNTCNKINDAVLDAWGRIMTRVPDARLLIKSHGLGDAQVRAAFVARLQSRGVDEQRLVIMGREPETARHLALYAEVDIALDTFPYNGTTTTCEALWQGVPVVCLEGKTHVSRVGQTLHQAVVLEDLTGRDVDGYVEHAVRLANDLGRIRELRRSMRERMQSSPLCDQPAFARNLEETLRGAWREWCQRPQTQS